MYWIYLPPIIFIGGLIALVVFIGKKSAAIKHLKDALPEKRNAIEDRSRQESRFKAIWAVALRWLDSIVLYLRATIKKSEAGLAGITKKIREKRLGRQKGGVSLGRESVDLNRGRTESVDLVRPERTVRKIDETSIGINDDLDLVHEEVIIRKRPEIIPKRIVPDIIAEDKVREDALIHRIAENPRDIEAYRELGDYYLAVGNIKDSKDSFKMVLKLRPRDIKAKSSLREIELRMRLGN